MNGWIKYYNNGSEYTGTDLAVLNGHASWSRSSFENMVGARLTYKDCELSIHGSVKHKFWQEDEMIALMNNTVVEPTFSKRRIMCKVLSSDYCFALNTDHRTKLKVYLTETSSDTDYIQIVPENNHGEWLVCELDCVKNKLNYYFRDEVNCNI